MDGSWVDFKTIKSAVTMQIVLDHYGIALRRSGKELRGRCPIHKGEGTDSFHVNTEKSVFNCFSAGCNAKGNVLDFVAAMEQCSIRDAALKLAGWYSISTAANESESGTAKGELQRAPGKEATGESDAPNMPLPFRLRGIDHGHRNLLDRGIEKETAEFFGAGFFSGKGSMSGRIVIPIENERGELVAYAGRSIDGAEPKYKFPVGFKKSQVVYNLVRAHEDSGGTTVVLVEGFFDCMKVTQAEFPCAALMGCSMSAAQENLLANHFNRIIVMLDGDDAGRTGAIEVAGRLARHVLVRTAELSDGKQPDQLPEEEIRSILEPLL